MACINFLAGFRGDVGLAGRKRSLGGTVVVAKETAEMVMYQKKMMAVVLLALVVLLAALNVGYYNISQEWKPDLTVFFWKRYPSLQFRFVNITTEHWGADWALTDENRQSVIDYCKYRHGTETGLDDPGDLNRCLAR